VLIKVESLLPESAKTAIFPSLASHGTPLPRAISAAFPPRRFRKCTHSRASASMIGASFPRAPLFPRPRDFFPPFSRQLGRMISHHDLASDPPTRLLSKDPSGWLRGLLRNVRGKAGVRGQDAIRDVLPAALIPPTNRSPRPFLPPPRLRREPASYTRTEPAIECRLPEVSPSGIRPRNSQPPFPATCDSTSRVRG